MSEMTPCERAFQELKRRLTSASILIVLERGQKYTVCKTREIPISGIRAKS